MAGWLAGGQAFYVVTRDSSGEWAHWIVDVASGEPRPLPLPEGVLLYANTFSPDATRFAARCPDLKAHCVYATEGGDPVPLPGAAPEWRAVAWDQNDRVYFRDRLSGVPEVLWRVDVATGHSERVAELAPADRSGVLGLTRVIVSRSGEAWSFSLIRSLSDLYVVTDLR